MLIIDIHYDDNYASTNRSSNNIWSQKKNAIDGSGIVSTGCQKGTGLLFNIFRFRRLVLTYFYENFSPYLCYINLL